MQKGSLVIGPDKNKGIGSETTYKKDIATTNKPFDAASKTDERKHLHGSINFGSHSNNFLSEAKSKFEGRPGEANKNAPIQTRKHNF